MEDYELIKNFIGNRPWRRLNNMVNKLSDDTSEWYIDGDIKRRVIVFYEFWFEVPPIVGIISESNKPNYLMHGACSFLQNDSCLYKFFRSKIRQYGEEIGHKVANH